MPFSKDCYLYNKVYFKEFVLCIYLVLDHEGGGYNCTYDIARNKKFFFFFGYDLPHSHYNILHLVFDLFIKNLDYFTLSYSLKGKLKRIQ